MDEQLAFMASRLNRLEKTNRWLMTVLVASFAVFLLTAAIASPSTLQAYAFELVSADGSVRAELTMRDGHPGLYLKDSEGVDRVAVFESEGTSALYIMDGDGVTRIGVAQFAHGGGGVALHGPESRGAAVLYFKDEGSLRFFDEDGAVTRSIHATDEEDE